MILDVSHGCDELRDDQQERLKPFVPGGNNGKRGLRSDNRPPCVSSVSWPAQRVIALSHDLTERLAAAAPIGDKGYDAGHLCKPIIRFGGAAVIPPKRNRIVQRPYDTDVDKERNIIERFFEKLKQSRRVATRYDNLLCNFMGFVKLASINTWLT